MVQMMLSGSQLLYAHLNEPPVLGLLPASGLCWVCGRSLCEGVPWDTWSGASFVGQNRVKAPSAEFVCPACVFFCSRTSPVPGRDPGPCSSCEGSLKISKPKRGQTKGGPCPKCHGTGKNSLGGNYRNYSHLYDEGYYENASKSEKSRIRTFLEVPHKGPWFAAIAESGQKHLIPWVPVNPQGGIQGRILFEERVVSLPEDRSLIPHIEALLNLRISKGSIETGDYSPMEWGLAIEPLQSFEAFWAHFRGSHWFALALWLAESTTTSLRA